VTADRGSGRHDRTKRRDITGVLVLDKPTGITSNGVLQAARRIFRARKAGHTGSLDPLASGVLPICFGEATKLSGWLLDARKTYEVTARLGERTDTADSTGVVIEIHDVPDLTRDQVSAILEGFLGPIEQVPPMYSALKQGGRRLYELARKGETVDRPPRKVTIHEIELLDLEDKDLRFRVCCSKGTYVRTLVEDLAAELGTVGHVAALRRTASGPFDIASAVTLEQLESEATSGGMGLDARLLSADSAVPDLPAVSLEPGEVDRIRCGQRIARGALGVEGPVRLYGPDGEMLGIGEMDGGRLLPRRMFVPSAPQGADGPAGPDSPCC
jgi:tRNA pseudouridine55 synthase